MDPEYQKNEFTKYITELAIRSTNNVIDSPKVTKGNNWHLLDAKGKYIQSSMDVYTRLVQVLDQLSYIPAFLSQYPDKRHLDRNNINELAYLQYHLEVHVHKVHTVLELMRLLINEIYQYGIPEKECIWETLRKQPGMKGSLIEKILNYYYKSFKTAIEIRHYNTHRGHFKDSGISDLSGILLIYEQGKKLNMDVSRFEEVYPRFLLKYKLRELRKRRAETVKDLNTSIFDIINKFTTALLPEFQRRISEFDSVVQK
jgi:hypothetical protein